MKLFSEFKIKGTVFQNRLAMAPMSRGFCKNGIPSQKVINYYARRAGDLGLIITEGIFIPHRSAAGTLNNPVMHLPKSQDGWKHLCRLVHAKKGRIFAQLWHVGPHRRWGIPPDPNQIALGPMNRRKDGRLVVKAMNSLEICEVVKAYGLAAQIAESLGFDGVEVHGAHGYLIDSFLWDRSNGRNDSYGGTFEKRMRFAFEVVQEIRGRVSKKFLISFRFSQWKISDYNALIIANFEEARKFVNLLLAAGVDIFHASNRQFFSPAFPGAQLTLSELVKSCAEVPTIAVGSIGIDSQYVSLSEAGNEIYRPFVPNILSALDFIEKGHCDFLAVGRPLAVDPRWARKLKLGQLERCVPYSKQGLGKLY